ncbi:hypothetical protein SMICM304S_06630 [Streptomyces microflavus]
MFRRTFWFTAGAAAGVWATTKVNREDQAADAREPRRAGRGQGDRDRHKFKDFALDVRDNMVRREAELGGALGLEAPVDPDLPRPAALRRRGGRARRAPEHVPQAPLQLEQPE